MLRAPATTRRVPPAFSAALLLVAALAAPRAARAGPCPLTDASVVAVYADVTGGVGTHSANWTRRFFDWWGPGGGGGGGGGAVAFFESAADLASCRALASYDGLLLWVQPGGEADNQSVALGPAGRDNILDFAASAHGHVYATCAGWYYSAGTYWWYGGFFPRAWMPHWWPTVEGPITAIASYPDYAPAQLSNGLTAIYYGGPCMGCANTSAALPPGAEALAYFDVPGVPKDAPAAVRYRGEFIDAFFLSPHPEATFDDLTCAPPLPPGCITAEQQLANWQFIANTLNEMMGTQFPVPGKL
jgi:hypothetical protein